MDGITAAKTQLSLEKSKKDENHGWCMNYHYLMYAMYVC